MLVGVRLGHGGEDALARMPARQSEDALNEPNRADATGGERRVGPLRERRADARTLADQAIDKRLLTRRGLGVTSPRGKHAGRHARVHHEERVALEDAHEVRVPPDADAHLAGTRLGKIDRDQVLDYHLRKGMTVQEVERWLGQNLNYDPSKAAPAAEVNVCSCGVPHLVSAR